MEIETAREILGVSPTADEDEIKRAWRRKIRDARRHDADGTTDRQKRINRAKDVLITRRHEQIDGPTRLESDTDGTTEISTSNAAGKDQQTAPTGGTIVGPQYSGSSRDSPISRQAAFPPYMPAWAGLLFAWTIRAVVAFVVLVAVHQGVVDVDETVTTLFLVGFTVVMIGSGASLYRARQFDWSRMGTVTLGGWSGRIAVGYLCAITLLVVGSLRGGDVIEFALTLGVFAVVVPGIFAVMIGVIGLIIGRPLIGAGVGALIGVVILVSPIGPMSIGTATAEFAAPWVPLIVISGVPVGALVNGAIALGSAFIVAGGVMYAIYRGLYANYADELTGKRITAAPVVEPFAALPVFLLLFFASLRWDQCS